MLKLLGQMMRFLKLIKDVDLIIDNKCFCNILNEFTCRLNSFLISVGGGLARTNLVNKNIHAIVRGHYEC